MLKNYFKIAFKVFMRRKFFTFISLFGISSTLLVLMVGAAFFDHIFGPFYPELKADRTLMVSMLKATNSTNTNNSSSPPGYAFLDRYVRTLPHAEKVSISTHPIGTLIQPVISYRGEVEVKSYLKQTDGAFWEILEMDFLEGQPFTEEDVEKANFVAVINEATRQRFFGDQAAVGKMIELEGQRFRVVGVVANIPAFRLTSFADIWVPLTTTKSKEIFQYKALTGIFQAMILAEKPADIPLIKEEFYFALSQVEYPRPETHDQVMAGADTFFEGIARIMFSDDKKESHPERLLAIIVAIMVLFMILPAISLININVSRIMERASEIGVRKAFGASSWTLVGQFVVENVLLTLVGGLIGFALAAVVLQLLSNSYLIPYAQFYVNYRIFAYGLLMAVLFGVFAGVYPAWKMSRLHPVEALRRRV